MAILPVALLFAVIGLFLLLEIKAERVGDPDLLSSRVQSEVFALPAAAVEPGSPQAVRARARRSDRPLHPAARSPEIRGLRRPP